MQKISLHPKQHDVFSNRSRFKVVAAGRRWGKSKLSQISLLDNASEKPGSLNWYVAPTYRMAKQIMWDDMNRMIPDKWIKRKNETFMRLDLINGSIIELKGADKEDSLRGVGLDYLVMDEMQDMRPGVWKTVLRPTLAVSGGGALFIGCVSKDTMVLPIGGARKISHFANGGDDKTLDDVNINLYGVNKEFHNADGFWNNGVVETVKIKSAKGFCLESSLPHPIITMSDNGIDDWKITKDLVIGDRIAIDRGMNVWGSSDPADGFSFIAKGSGFKAGSHLGDLKMTDDIAYLMGLWIAEGSFEKNGRIAITCGDNVGDFLTTGEIAGIKFIEQAKNENCSTWRVSSQHLLRYMEYIGMSMCGARDKTFPQWVFNGKKTWASSFIAGMFDGDGHVLKSGGMVGYTSSSKELIDKLQLILLNFGIISHVGFLKRRESNGLVEFSGDCYQLAIHGTNIGIFRDNISLRIKRKQRLLNEIKVIEWSRHDGVPNQQGNIAAVISACPDKNKRARLSVGKRICVDAVLYKNADISYRSLSEFLVRYSFAKGMAEYDALAKHCRDGYFWDVVVGLESNSAMTYDFTIPDTHSFWSNGFVSHNTSKGYNHFYDVWMRGMSGDSRMWKSWQFPTASSPFVPNEEIENARSDMDPKTFRQEFQASFENMSGRVYHVFDRKLHVGEYKFNPKLPIYIGQDFNIDPMSSAIMQIQPNGDVWAVDEIVLFSSNTQEVCEEIERKYWRYTNQITIYPDPAGGSRQHARGETDLDIFREKGFKRLKFHRKHPRIIDRVNAVNKMLLTADGDIRMRVDSSCKNLITSLEQTMYKPGGREIDKAMSVEHITDGLGYFIEFEFPARKVHVAGISL